MKKLLVLIVGLQLLFCNLPLSTCRACTSIIISGKATADGRPVMFKNRDTDCLDNRVERYQGKNYAFIGLVNAPRKTGEVWAGINEAGFCIMNTASYNIKDDNVPDKQMDKEGALMFDALGECATVDDFRRFLENRRKPMGVEANFGVIDAQGGAFYFEVNNQRFWEYDVNLEPAGFRVVTNFSFAGRPEDNQGEERYKTATSIMNDYLCAHTLGQYDIKHGFLMNHFSRSYRHAVLGTPDDFCPASGIIVDQDFIPRRITSAAVTIEGVRPGENPAKTVMWTALGYPATSPAIPLLVGPSDILPDYVTRFDKDGHSRISDYSNDIKYAYVFPDKTSNGKRYLHIDAVQKGVQGRPALKQCARVAETVIDQAFLSIYTQWLDNAISDSAFYALYQAQQPSYFTAYTNAYYTYKH